MKKELTKNTKDFYKKDGKPWPEINKGEKNIDTVPLTAEVSQEYRAFGEEIQPSKSKNIHNWSQEDDRSEDLINARDPFMQQPERDSEIPPELNPETSDDDK